MASTQRVDFYPTADAEFRRFLQWQTECHAQAQRLEQMDDGAIPTHFSEHVSHYRYARACAVIDREAGKPIRRTRESKQSADGCTTATRLQEPTDRSAPSRVKWREMKTVTAHDHRYRELPRSSPRSISLQRVGRRVYRTIPRSL